METLGAEIREWRDDNINHLCEEKIRDLVVTVAQKSIQLFMERAREHTFSSQHNSPIGGDAVMIEVLESIAAEVEG